MNSKQKFYHVNPILCIAYIAVFAFLLRALIGAFYYNGFDLIPYNIPWAIGTKQGVFSIYANVENLDYPPLFPFLLSLVGNGVDYATQMKIPQMQMFLVKLIPILFDTALVVLLYFIGLKYSQTFAILLSSVWALNISAIFNCSYWGQTDSILLVFVLLTMVAFERQMPFLACVCFAIGCLAKLQMAYFTPIILCELFFRYKPWRAVQALCAGLSAGILGWLPFMIGAHSLTLPLDIYFGGFGKYNYINLNAYNVYGLTENNWVTDKKSMIGGTFDPETMQKLGGFTYSHWSTIITLFILFVLIASYLYARKKQIEVPVCLNAMLFMNSIFMFTTKMHERYQLPVLILVLLCFVICKDKRYFYAFIGLTLVTFFNQSALLFSNNFPDTFSPFVSNFQRIGSIVNVLIFIYLMFLYIDFHMSTSHNKMRELVV